VQLYLGTAKPQWLPVSDAPLMISHRTLAPRRTHHRAKVPWVLDSGGFTEIATNGRWTLGPGEYATAVHRYQEEIGQLEWCAPQDWMCEPTMIAKTGLSIAEHQARTVGNFLDLKSIDAGLPVIPVLQGWELPDYERCIDLYDKAGVDLLAEPTVGLGSVCRRQSTSQIHRLVYEIASTGLRLHGFGVKTSGLARYGDLLHSADSFAWSFTARRERIQLPGCTHVRCGNCLKYALVWREAVLRKNRATDPQMSLF
jgi:hypothetical protein